MNVQDMKRLVSERMIKQVGAEFDFKHIVIGEYDPLLGKATTTEVVYKMWASRFNYFLKNSGSGLHTEQQIGMNDRKIYVLPREDGVKPQAGNWQMKLDGEWWAVISVREVMPSGVSCLIECQVRKA